MEQRRRTRATTDRTSRTTVKFSSTSMTTRTTRMRMLILVILTTGYCFLPVVVVEGSAVTATTAGPPAVKQHSTQLVSTATTTAAPATDKVSMSSTSDTTSCSNDNDNKSPPAKAVAMVGTLATYLKDSIVRTVTGCGTLWTNHGTCNDIRRKLKAHRQTVKEQWEREGLYRDDTPKELAQRLELVQGGITYEEFRFLIKGKEDRGKTMNLGFLMWGAPRFLPYALMFNPDMLPSPFQMPKDNKEALATTLARTRTHVLLSTLMAMEDQAAAVPGGMLSMFNGKKKQAAADKLQRVVHDTGEWLSRSLPPPAAVLQHLEGNTNDSGNDENDNLLYRTATTDFSRAEQRLCHLPSCIATGLSRAIAGSTGVVAEWTPAFLQRGRLVGHVQSLAAADDFLVQAGAAAVIDSMAPALLQEACQDRFLASTNKSVEDMKVQMMEWLELTVTRPAARVLALQSQLPVAVDDDTITKDSSKAKGKGKPEPPLRVFYNGNLARTVLLAYNGCVAAKESGNPSRLPQLLYTGNKRGAVSINIVSRSNENADKGDSGKNKKDKQKSKRNWRIPFGKD